jgi:hypothetical protein
LATVGNPLLAHSPLIERDLTRSMRLFLGWPFLQAASAQPIQ